MAPDARARASMTHGVLVLDKPAGVSSAKALEPVKKTFGKKTRVGHAGTLDPFATGVLLALLGDATRLSALAMALPKTYRATVRFGAATDTLDPEGEVVAEEEPGPAAPEGLAEAVMSFLGETDQLPPAYSALKVDGRRAYALSRSGMAPTLKPRRVTVHAIALREVRWPEADVEVTCGAGFYVRALARDLGAKLRLPAHLTALRRTSIGPFRAGEACAPEAASAEHVRPPLDLVRAAGIPEVALPEDEARRFAAGAGLTAAGHEGQVAVLLAGPDPMLVGIADADRDGRLRPRAVLASARRSLER